MSVTATLAGMKTALDLLKDAMSKRDAHLIESALREVNESRLKTEQMAFDLLEKNHDLQAAKSALAEAKHEVEKELVALKDFRSELERDYHIAQTARGGHVYVSNAPVKDGEEPVRLCANCAATFKKTYLQPANQNRMLHCPNGHGDIPFMPLKGISKNAVDSIRGPNDWMSR